MAIVLFLLLFLIALLVPQIFIILLVPNLFAGLFLSILQISVALLPYFHPQKKDSKKRPLVSIFVPAYNEPPTVLMHTLESLSRLKYENFRVLVIDNNTQDENIWKPVQSFVETLGEKFRFFHVDKLAGFKAGALNYLLERMDGKSEYVAVIDADYLVKPDFLVIALPYFFQSDMALVQFPQRYRNCIKRNQPIADEYRHFFGIYMNMSNYLDCVPSTGTVSVYRSDVLKQIGGFRGEMLTEDADVGLRIYEAGYRGIYVDLSVGFGLMPYDLESYKKQKWRWAFGNAQSIRKLFSMIGKISLRSWIGFLLNLTAWDHFNFLPFIMMATYAFLIAFDVPVSFMHQKSFEVAFLSIAITLASKQFLFILALRKKKNFLFRSIRAFLVHMGMTVIYSEAWVLLLLQAKFAFERTNKFILEKVPNVFRCSYKEATMGTWFFWGALAAMKKGEEMAGVSFLVASLILFSIYYVHWKIFPTKDCSKKMICKAQKRYAFHTRDT